MKQLISLVGLVICFGACQPQTLNTKDQEPDLKAFATLAEGIFETPKDSEDSIIRDRRVRVKSPHLEGVWMYSQLNTGRDYKIYRQRVFRFTPAQNGQVIVQNSFGLKMPELYMDAWKTPDLLSSLSPEDIEPYFSDGCEQNWTAQPGGAWRGYVDPKTCVIMSTRRNKEIRIESEGYLSKDVYQTTERGFEMDMSFLWGSKPGEMITLNRVP